MLERKTVEKVIGKGFADKLDEEVFKVNLNWFYTRREMVEELGCANFVAAARLAKVLKRLEVANPAKLFKLDPYSLARSRGIGEAALFVAMCILDAKQYNVTDWWQWNDNTVKFSSFKANAIRRSSRRKQEVA